MRVSVCSPVTPPVAPFPLSPGLPLRGLPQAVNAVPPLVASAGCLTALTSASHAALPSATEPQVSPLSQAKPLELATVSPIRLLSNVSTATSGLFASGSTGKLAIASPVLSAVPSLNSEEAARAEAAIAQLRLEVGVLRDDVKGVRATLAEELRKHNMRLEPHGELRTAVLWLSEELASRDREAQQLRQELEQRRLVLRTPETRLFSPPPASPREISRSLSAPFERRSSSPAVVRHASAGNYSQALLDNVSLSSNQPSSKEDPQRLIDAGLGFPNAPPSQCSSRAVSRVSSRSASPSRILTEFRRTTPETAAAVSLGTPHQALRSSLQPSPVLVNAATASRPAVVIASNASAGFADTMSSTRSAALSSTTFAGYRAAASIATATAPSSCSASQQQLTLEDAQDSAASESHALRPGSVAVLAEPLAIGEEALKTEVAAQLKEMVSARAADARAADANNLTKNAHQQAYTHMNGDFLLQKSATKKSPRSPGLAYQRSRRPSRKQPSPRNAANPLPVTAPVEGKPTMYHQPGVWSPGSGLWSPPRPSSTTGARSPRGSPLRR